MKEIIFKGNKKSYRWKPTKWQIALWYLLGMTVAIVSIYICVVGLYYLGFR